MTVTTGNSVGDNLPLLEHVQHMRIGHNMACVVSSVNTGQELLTTLLANLKAEWIFSCPHDQPYDFWAGMTSYLKRITRRATWEQSLSEVDKQQGNGVLFFDLDSKKYMPGSMWPLPQLKNVSIILFSRNCPIYTPWWPDFVLFQQFEYRLGWWNWMMTPCTQSAGDAISQKLVSKVKEENIEKTAEAVCQPEVQSSTAQLFQRLTWQQQQPELFNLKNLPRAGVFFCVGNAGCGKSTLAQQLLQHQLCQGTQYVVLVRHDSPSKYNFRVPTDKTVLSLPMHVSSSEEALQSIMDHQRRCSSDNIVIVADDAPLRDVRKPNESSHAVDIYATLFRDAAKLNIALIVTRQYVGDLPPSQRSDINYMFAFKHPGNMYLIFFKDSPEGFKVFEKTLENGGNYCCAVFNPKVPDVVYRHIAEAQS